MPFIPTPKPKCARCSRRSGRRARRRCSTKYRPRCARLARAMPPAMTEMEIGRQMSSARAGRAAFNFISAGAYEHHIPAAVWAIVTRGEFYSAYTPYQAEASQGTLQLLYEYQTMMAEPDRHAGVERVAVRRRIGAGRSLSDGRACARTSKSQRILMPDAVNPTYRDVARAITGNQSLVLETAAVRSAARPDACRALGAYSGQDITALVIQQPNFFGVLQDVDLLTELCPSARHARDRRRQSNVARDLEAAGQWGTHSVDIVCGKDKPLGVPCRRADRTSVPDHASSSTCARCRAAYRPPVMPTASRGSR